MNVKLVTTVPHSHAEAVRQAMTQAGAGQIGNYKGCSFTVEGVGRFVPEVGAHPTIGAIGQEQEVREDRIETTCPADLLAPIITALRQAHPYEEPAIDVYALLDEPEADQDQQ